MEKNGKQINIKVFKKTVEFIQYIENEIGNLRTPHMKDNSDNTIDIAAEWVDIYLSLYVLHAESNRAFSGFLKDYHSLLKRISEINPHIEQLKEAIAYVEDRIEC